MAIKFSFGNIDHTAPSECPQCGFLGIFRDISNGVWSADVKRTPDVRTRCPICGYDHTTTGTDVTDGVG